MATRWIFGLVTLLAAHAVFVTDMAQAFKPDKDWPCAQRKREHLSPGAIWQGPDVTKQRDEWSKNEKAAALVKTLSSRRTSVEDGKKKIESFASSLLQSDNKNEMLTMVFAGLFNNVDKSRAAIVKGIEKYTKRQKALSEKIKESAVEVDELSNKEELTDADEKKLEELNQKLQWDTRIYDEREKSLEFVCESPVILEQRLFAFSKKIEEHLVK